MQSLDLLYLIEGGESTAVEFKWVVALAVSFLCHIEPSCNAFAC